MPKIYELSLDKVKSVLLAMNMKFSKLDYKKKYHV